MTEENKFAIKSHGTCGVFEFKSREELGLFIAAIKQRGDKLKDWKKCSVDIHTENEKELKVKFKSTANEKSKDNQITITLYKGESSKRFMIQCSNVKTWINAEFPLLQRLANGVGYDDLQWEETWLTEKSSETSILNKKEPSVNQKKEIGTVMNSDTPKVSREKRNMFLKKAGESITRRIDLQSTENENLLKSVELLEHQIIELKEENENLKDTLVKTNKRLCDIERRINKMGKIWNSDKIDQLKQECKNQLTKSQQGAEKADEATLEIMGAFDDLKVRVLMLEDDMEKQTKNPTKKPRGGT